MTEHVWKIQDLGVGKILKSDVDEWIAKLKLGYPYEYGGGIRFDGFSYNDADINIYPPDKEPCPCKDLFPLLPSATFNIQIFCKRCGATLNYATHNDTWIYQWSHKSARIVKTFPPSIRGLDIELIKKILDDITTLKTKLNKKVK